MGHEYIDQAIAVTARCQLDVKLVDQVTLASGSITVLWLRGSKSQQNITQWTHVSVFADKLDVQAAMYVCSAEEGTDLWFGCLIPEISDERSHPFQLIIEKNESVHQKYQERTKAEQESQVFKCTLLGAHYLLVDGNSVTFVKYD